MEQELRETRKRKYSVLVVGSQMEYLGLLYTLYVRTVGEVGSVDASHLHGSWFDPERGMESVWSYSMDVLHFSAWASSGFSGFLPPSWCW